LVSVVIAARNEELDLGPALDGLLLQRYPSLEIIVVDGGSTDRTREVARARGPRVRLIEEPPLPPGWVGKNWACDVGYRASQGEYLLFTDADMRYHPDAIGATVAWAEAENADLATLAPTLEVRSFWEKVVLPFYVQMVLTYFRTPRVNRDDSRAAMANGQFTLLRRGPYEALGGHAAIRGYVLEDVALARRYRSAGKRLRVAWAPDLLSTRMYRDRHELFEGLRKNVHDTRFSVGRQLVFLAGVIGLFLLPLLVLPVGFLGGSIVLEALGLLVYVAWFAKHSLFARAIGMSGAYGLLFPVAAGFYVVLLASSLASGLRGTPVTWKGRSYPMDGEGTVADPSLR
ncbi:MAG TPA: glycosyltransferase family 2 protein, partial [Thermoplasmata archaeon]|nr:glycosyltransferase family 2 protein [Thermoplasmata archaeon]